MTLYDLIPGLVEDARRDAGRTGRRQRIFVAPDPSEWGVPTSWIGPALVAEEITTPPAAETVDDLDVPVPPRDPADVWGEAIADFVALSELSDEFAAMHGLSNLEPPHPDSQEAQTPDDLDACPRCGGRGITVLAGYFGPEAVTCHVCGGNGTVMDGRHVAEGRPEETNADHESEFVSDCCPACVPINYSANAARHRSDR